MRDSGRSLRFKTSSSLCFRRKKEPYSAYDLKTGSPIPHSLERRTRQGSASVRPNSVPSRLYRLAEGGRKGSRHGYRLFTVKRLSMFALTVLLVAVPYMVTAAPTPSVVAFPIERS